MKTTHLGTFTDQETGDELELHFDPDGHNPNVRNAPRDHRPGSPGGSKSFMPTHGAGFSLVRNPPPRTPATRDPEKTHHPRATDPGRPARNVTSDGEYLAIKKEALVDLISIAGDAYASFLARPDVPRATGDNKTDFDNAALHRDALALHDQNRDRIRTISGLVERTARLLLS